MDDFEKNHGGDPTPSPFWSRWLRRLTTLPPVVNPAETRKAERLHTILLGLCILSLVYSLFYIVVSVRYLQLNLLIMLVSTTIFIGALWWLRRGRLRLATWIVIGYFYLAIPTIALAFDGIHDTALTAFFLIVGIVGLIRGGRAAFVTASVATFALIGVYLLDRLAGGITPPAQSPFLKVVEMGGLLLLVGLVLRMTLSDLNHALLRSWEEVAERKRVERALVEARDRLEERVVERTAALTEANRNLETLIETNQDGVIFLTGEGALTVVNTRALDLLGLPGEPEAWVGQHLDDLLSTFLAWAPIKPDVLEQEIERVLADPGESYDGEVQVGDRFLHWYFSTTLVEDDVPAQLIVLRDVTARRQAERMRNDLISTMVHDLRNPLSSMLSLLSTLTWLDTEGREALTGRQRRYVERSMETVREMNQLVSNILDVSRLESRQMPLQPEAVPLRELILETIAAQQPLASQKELLLVTEIPATLPPARADVGLLERILQNLVDNAIKFTPAGGEVRVLARLEEGGGEGERMLEIAVADTGPGIAPALKEELFQKFVAGDGEACGSGLGLAFCKLAVEAHGGQIAVASEVGQGTVFTFSLPTANGDYPNP